MVSEPEGAPRGGADGWAGREAAHLEEHGDWGRREGKVAAAGPVECSRRRLGI